MRSCFSDSILCTANLSCTWFGKQATARLGSTFRVLWFCIGWLLRRLLLSSRRCKFLCDSVSTHGGCKDVSYHVSVKFACHLSFNHLIITKENQRWLRAGTKIRWLLKIRWWFRHAGTTIMQRLPVKQMNIHVSAFSIYVGSGPDLRFTRST